MAVLRAINGDRVKTYTSEESKDDVAVIIAEAKTNKHLARFTSPFGSGGTFYLNPDHVVYVGD